jgi:hypothetical protein
VGTVGVEEERALWLVLRCFHLWGLDAALDACVSQSPPPRLHASTSASASPSDAHAGPVATAGMPGAGRRDSTAGLMGSSCDAGLGRQEHCFGRQ